MKKRNIIVLSCFLLLAFIVAGFLLHIKNASKDQSEVDMVQTTAEVKDYLYQSKDNMTLLAAELIRYESSGLHLQYYPAKNELYKFENSTVSPNDRLKEHPVLGLAAFMAGNDVFTLVSPSTANSVIAAEHCEFLKAVEDGDGDLLCYVELIYCPVPFEENEYAVLEQVLPNWFLYIWDFA